LKCSIWVKRGSFGLGFNFIEIFLGIRLNSNLENFKSWRKSPGGNPENGH